MLKKFGNMLVVSIRFEHFQYNVWEIVKNKILSEYHNKKGKIILYFRLFLNFWIFVEHIFREDCWFSTSAFESDFWKHTFLWLIVLRWKPDSFWQLQMFSFSKLSEQALFSVGLLVGFDIRKGFSIYNILIFFNQFFRTF